MRQRGFRNLNRLPYLQPVGRGWGALREIRHGVDHFPFVIPTSCLRTRISRPSPCRDNDLTGAHLRFRHNGWPNHTNRILLLSRPRTSSFKHQIRTDTGESRSRHGSVYIYRNRRSGDWVVSASSSPLDHAFHPPT